MKKIVPFVVGVASCFVSCTFAAAQTPTDKLSQDFADVSIHKAIVLPRLSAGVLQSINIKAVRYFLKTYPSISNETWEKCKDGFVVKFFANSIETKNYFDKKGNWLHSIKRYDESKLPRGIRAAVRSNYYDYLITQVQEIINTHKSYAEPEYLVHIQCGNVFKLIRVCSDEMDEVEFKE